MEGSVPRARRRLSPWKVGLLVVGVAILLALAWVAYRLAVPPAPFPIPPGLALDYPQERFDSSDNAWHLYQRAAELARQSQKPLDPLRPPQEQLAWQRKDPLEWSDEEAEHAREWVEAHAEALAVFRQAAAKPYFVEQRIVVETPMPHLGLSYTLARVLTYAAGIALREGDEERAVDDLLTALGAAAHLSHYGPLISRLTADAIEALVTRRLWEALSNGRIRKPASLKRVIRALTDHEHDRFPLADTFRVEYLLFHETLERWARGANGRQRGMLGPTSGHGLFGVDWQELGVEAELRLFYPRSLRNLTAYYQRKIHELEADVTVPLREDLREAHAEPAELTDPISKLLLPTYSGVIRRGGATIVGTRAVLLAAALQLYRLEQGAYPPSLRALVPRYLEAIPLDPFDGALLRARPDGNGYVIWSAGPDGVDQGGATSLRRNQMLTGQPGDLVWRLEAGK